jgi:hypothetical protein
MVFLGASRAFSSEVYQPQLSSGINMQIFSNKPSRELKKTQPAKPGPAAYGTIAEQQVIDPAPIQLQDTNAQADFSPYSGPIESHIQEPDHNGRMALESPSSSCLGRAQKELLDISRELSQNLVEYARAKDAGDAKTYFGSEAPVDMAQVGDLSSETVRKLIETFVVQRLSQKPSIAAEVGSILGKLYPVTALALGIGAAAAEV